MDATAETRRLEARLVRVERALEGLRDVFNAQTVILDFLRRDIERLEQKVAATEYRERLRSGNAAAFRP